MVTLLARKRHLLQSERLCHQMAWANFRTALVDIQTSMESSILTRKFYMPQDL